MPRITDQPPLKIREDLRQLAQALDAQIPPKTINNFLIATWNIRAFASLTRKWTASAADSPKRDLRGLRAIIEILARFDVIAIQEVKGDLRALRDTIHYLRHFGNWGFLMSDITLGTSGGGERLMFLFDRSRVTPSGLAAELVVPPERLGIGPDALTEQFARTPYAVSFQRADSTVILVTLHVLFGQRETDRLAELREIARWMSEWAAQTNRYEHNLIGLGDFNIDRRGSDGYDQFVETGLTVPEVLIDLPRTIFDDPGDSSDDNFYDQIAWFTSGKGALINLTLRRGGNFNFLPHVYTETGLNRQSVSYRISDHYPLWVEFLI